MPFYVSGSLKIRFIAILLTEESARKAPSKLCRVNLGRHMSGRPEFRPTRHAREVGRREASPGNRCKTEGNVGSDAAFDNPRHAALQTLAPKTRLEASRPTGAADSPTSHLLSA